MVQQLNSKDVKDRILRYLEEKGPSLPVQIAKYLSMNSLFASAFLSEMASDGTIIISDMKVGGSPLYYSKNKEYQLENFFNSLGSKEREACLLLKEKKILEDASQHPAIRVALRGLKDFAFPFKKDEKIFWRYFLISEEEVRKIFEEKKEEPKKEAITQKVEEEKKPIEQKIEEKAQAIIEQDKGKNEELENINRELEEKKKELELLKIQLSGQKEKSQPETKISKKLKGQKKIKIEDEFLNELKPYLQKNQIELLQEYSFDKKQALLKIRTNNIEKLLFAFNRKKIEHEDILKAHKKASLMNLPFVLLSRGDIPKSLKESMEAYKKLESIEKME
jgi:hypothetical protein